MSGCLLQMASALPKWVRLSWLIMAPAGLALAARIAWEKAQSYGHQMIGFGLMHRHPLFFLSGILCCYGLLLWLLGVVIFLMVKRRHPASMDLVMCLLSLFVLLAFILPD